MLRFTRTRNPIARRFPADMTLRPGNTYSYPVVCITRAIDTRGPEPAHALLHDSRGRRDRRRGGKRGRGKAPPVSAEIDMTAAGVDPLDFDMLLIPAATP